MDKESERIITALKSTSLTRDEKESLEILRSMRKDRRRKGMEGIDFLLRSIGNAFPKGIRNPDKAVTNLGFYVPTQESKKNIFTPRIKLY